MCDVSTRTVHGYAHQSIEQKFSRSTGEGLACTVTCSVPRICYRMCTESLCFYEAGTQSESIEPVSTCTVDARTCTVRKDASYWLQLIDSRMY